MEINEYLAKLIKISRGLEALDPCKDVQLSGTEFRLLQEVLEEHEAGHKIISSELARRLGITRSAVSQIVTKLERRNIVKRTPSDKDKKIAYIMLSDYSAQMIEEQGERVNAFIGKVVGRFGEERMQTLLSETEALTEVFHTVKNECQNK